MRIVIAAIVFAPLLLVGVLPAFAGQPASQSPAYASTDGVASTGTTTDRNTYTQRAQDEVQEWRRKLHDFSEQAKVKGQSARNASGNKLNEAWSKTKAASHKLRTASADSWEGAKTSFEKASHRLADAWHQIHPEEKEAGAAAVQTRQC